MKQITEINSKFDLKKVVVIMAAICMMVTILPMVNASDSDDLQTAINNTATGGVLALDRNYTITAPVTINKSMTIDGTESKYSITNSSGSNAINVTSSGVTIKNLSITTNGSAYSINGTGSDLTVMDCTISSTGRGINFYPSANSESTLTVTDTTIDNPTAEAGYGVNYGADNRGISTGNVIGGHVTITSCDVTGYKYGINTVVTDDNNRDSNGTVFDITDSHVHGWAALNISCANTTFNITNCKLTGVNKFSGGANEFSVININEVTYNYSSASTKVNIIGGQIHVYRYGECKQSAVFVDKDGHTDYKFNRGTSGKVMIYGYGTDEYKAEAFSFAYNSTVNEFLYKIGTKYSLNAQLIQGSVPSASIVS